MANEIVLGIIGAGRIGQVHAHTFSGLIPGAKVAYVADVVSAAAQTLAGKCGAKATSDYNEILHDPAVTAVAICSSTDTHAELIEKSALAGKHVFCEKPIALNLKRIDLALSVVEKSGVQLMIGFNRRFDAGNLRLREAVSSGLVGKPELCVITSRDPTPPPIEYIKVSGGMFLDMSIHDFDLARYLLDDEPVEIFAHTGCLVDPAIGAAGDVDTAMVSIRFAGGALCHINNSRRAAYGYDQRAEVFGSAGMALTRNHHDDNTELALKSGFSRPPLKNFFMERYLQAYRKEGMIFAECVRDGVRPPVTGADGRAAAVMGYAAGLSAKEGRPVSPDEIG